jgi:hypothetical protein
MVSGAAITMIAAAAAVTLERRALLIAVALLG